MVHWFPSSSSSLSLVVDFPPGERREVWLADRLGRVVDYISHLMNDSDQAYRVDSVFVGGIPRILVRRLDEGAEAHVQHPGIWAFRPSAMVNRSWNELDGHAGVLDADRDRMLAELGPPFADDLSGAMEEEVEVRW